MPSTSVIELVRAVTIAQGAPFFISAPSGSYTGLVTVRARSLVIQRESIDVLAAFAISFAYNAVPAAAPSKVAAVSFRQLLLAISSALAFIS